MKIKLDKKTKNKLLHRGFSTLLEGKMHVHDKSKFELPCEIIEADLGFKLEVGCYSYIGRDFRNYNNVKIGRFCSIAEGVKVGLGAHPLDRFSTSPAFYAKDWSFSAGAVVVNKELKVIPEKGYDNFGELMKVEIGDDVWIGANACILGGVKIGNGAVIATGAVVTKDVPDFEIWGGVPAKKISSRKVQKKNWASKFKTWEILEGKDFPPSLNWKKRIKLFVRNLKNKK